MLVESLVGLSNSALKRPNSEKFREVAEKACVDIIQQLHTEHHTLYRKKADYAAFLSQTVVHIPSHNLRKEIVQKLVQLWRDPDAEVRKVSINMIKFMGEMCLPEVMTAFEARGENETYSRSRRSEHHARNSDSQQRQRLRRQGCPARFIAMGFF